MTKKLLKKNSCCLWTSKMVVVLSNSN